MSRLWLVVFLATTACGAMNAQEQAHRFHGIGPIFYIASFQAQPGKLDANLQAVKDGQYSRSPASRWPKVWLGYDGGNMCVYERRHEPMAAGETAEGQTRRYQRMLDDTQVLFAAHDSLDAVPESFPAAPTNSQNRLTSEDLTSKTRYDSDYDKRTTYYTEANLVFCGPAPTVSASTRAITVAFYRKGEDPELYAWDIEGEPAARAAPAVAAKADVTPASTSGKPLVLGQSRVGTLKDNAYRGFIDIADCAKKYALLRDDKYAVLAFDDATIVRLEPDKARRQRFRDACSAIANAHLATTVGVGADGVMIRAVGLDGKTRTGKMTRPPIETNEGWIYTVGEVWSE